VHQRSCVPTRASAGTLAFLSADEVNYIKESQRIVEDISRKMWSFMLNQ
jgi:hypothetical protein